MDRRLEMRGKEERNVSKMRRIELALKPTD